MSEANVELVRRAWEAFERGDAQTAFEIFDPDVEWDVSHDVWGDIVGGGHYRGPQGVATWLRDLYEAWESFEMSTDEVLDAGDDRVVCVLIARGKGRASGLEVEHRPAGVATLRGGRIVRIVWYPTREEALAAAGRSG